MIKKNIYILPEILNDTKAISKNNYTIFAFLFVFWNIKSKNKTDNIILKHFNY
jgi:hypothetical protein